FSLFVAYTCLSYYWSRKESAIAAEIAEKCDEFTESEAEKMPSTGTNLLYLLGGLIGLVIGSEVLVKGAVTIAQIFGLSDEIIGLTLIAIGTSLPELATSVVAARKGQSEIALGNVVGSNIFNVLGIVGCAATVSWFNSTPETQVLAVSPNMLGIHIPLMVVVSLGVLPIMSTGMQIVRAEGALLVAVYLAYNVVLFQTTTSTLPVPDLKKHEASSQTEPKDSVTATASENIDTASQAQILPAATEPPVENQPALPVDSSANASGSVEPASATVITGE
ncbi:MAG: hypothetical protein ACD_39C00991G0001, partial [uncultured bacterium]